MSCSVCFVEQQNDSKTSLTCEFCNNVCCMTCYNLFLQHNSSIILKPICIGCKEYLHEKEEKVVNDMILDQIDVKTTKQRNDMKIVKDLKDKIKLLKQQILTTGQKITSIVEEDDEIHAQSFTDNATLELLNSETKSCPNCKSWISRTEGCKKMFCIQCHTYFDYESGSVIQPTENPEANDFRKSYQSKNDLFPHSYKTDLLHGTIIRAAMEAIKKMYHVESKNRQLPFKIKNQRKVINNLHIHYNEAKYDKGLYLLELKKAMLKLNEYVNEHKIYNKYMNRIESLPFPSVTVYANIAEDVLNATHEMNKELQSHEIIASEDEESSDEESDDNYAW